MPNPVAGVAALRLAPHRMWANCQPVVAETSAANVSSEELVAAPHLVPAAVAQAPELTPDTPMQKVVLPGLVDLTLGNVVVPARFDPHRVAGFVTRLQDVPPGSAADLMRRYGLHEVPGWPLAEDLHVLRFYAHSPDLYVAPFERKVYQIDLLELPAGAELWRIDPDGAEERVGAYLNRQVGWVSTAPVPLGPAGWNQAPVALQPSVRRGLIATLRGHAFDADFGPRPGEVTLHPVPGRRPPKTFTEQAGIYTLTLPIGELDALELVRWRAAWHGLPVEVVESGPQIAVIHYIGENGQRAASLGLAEVDYRVWRGPVLHGELAGVQQLRIPLGPTRR